MPRKCRALRGAAFRMFTDKCRDIISGGDEVSTYMLDQIFCPEDTILYAWRNILSSCQYISFRNRNYCSDFWKVPRGDLAPSIFVQNLTPPACCSPSGSYVKIFNEVNNSRGTTEYASTVAALSFRVGSYLTCIFDLRHRRRSPLRCILGIFLVYVLIFPPRDVGARICLVW